MDNGDQQESRICYLKTSLRNTEAYCS